MEKSALCQHKGERRKSMQRISFEEYDREEQRELLHYFSEEEIERFVHFLFIRGTVQQNPLKARYLEIFDELPEYRYRTSTHRFDDERYLSFLRDCLELFGMKDIRTVYVPADVSITGTYFWCDTTRNWEPLEDSEVSDQVNLIRAG